MNRFIRMRRYNPSSTTEFDTLFPQSQTGNIVRQENGGVLESDLLRYDRHLNNTVIHINRALSEGTARALLIRLKHVILTDGFPLLLTLHTTLECEPTISFNDGPPYPIKSANGDRVPGGQEEGSVIFLVWNEKQKCWTLLSADNFSDITRVVLPVETEYVYTALHDGEETVVIPGFNKRTDKISINYHQTILRFGVDFSYLETSDNTIILKNFSLTKDEQLFFTITSYITTAKRGRIQYDLETHDIPVTITEDNCASVFVPTEALDAHSVVINYNQTILRNNLDYVYNDKRDTILFKDFTLDKGEQLVFTVTQFVETNGELIPNNWGTTGNYRYSLNVIHTEYTATEDNITVIPVPNFNPRRDDVAVIRDNKLFVYDVDYTIDEIGNVVLLKGVLNTNESIYFTILQGAMIDVPNFNVIQGNGYDGQHIHLDMSYSILVDYYTLLVRLKHDLKTAPTIKCVDGPAEPICDCFGSPIVGGYKAGSYIWLVYSEAEHVWYSMSHSQIDLSTLVPQNKVTTGESNFVGFQLDPNDKTSFIEATIEHMLGSTPEKITITPCEPPNILEDGSITTIGDIWTHADDRFLYVGNSGNATSKFKWMVSTEDATNDLRGYLEKELAVIKTSPGNIITHLSTYTAQDSGINKIDNITNYNAKVDKIIINFNQTVLREDIDYRTNINTNGIKLLNFTLDAGDVLQFTVLSQVDKEE